MRGARLNRPWQISPHEVEIALQRPWWQLKLPPALESAFETVTGPDRCRHLIIYGLVGVLLYDAYLLTDLRLVPDIFDSAVLLRLGMVTPLAVATMLFMRTNPTPVFRESAQAGLTVLIVASVLWLTAASQNPMHIYRHVGVILIVLFANVVMRLRFWYAVATSLTALALYVATVLGLHDIPQHGQVTAVVVLANTVLFTLMATHAMERDARREFLFRLQDGLRRAELEKMAHRDPLTGLGNRRQLDVTLERLWQEALAGGRSLALLMLDIDAFKAFNDRYGHLAGDVCLQRVSAVVSAELRGSRDVVARFGGEELVMVLAGMDLGEAIAIAERVRKAVEAVGIPHGDSPRHVVTVSIGVAAGVPDPKFDRNAFLAGADAALYAAKRNGRNQVWPPLPGGDDALLVIAEDLPVLKTG